jgi:glycerate dehydrogenase
MKMVILDGYTLNPGDLSWEGLERMGTLTVYDRTPSDRVMERIGDAKIIFTNKVPITAETFDKTNIIYVGVLATGYDIVDVEAAKEKGIPVTNIPTYATNSVAQMVFAHLLEICHHVYSHNESVKEGTWTKNACGLHHYDRTDREAPWCRVLRYPEGY